MENQTENNELIVYNNSLELFKNGGEILQENITIAQKAVNAGNNILNTIAESGVMTAELDKKCNDYNVLITTRIKQMNESRSPVTQMMTMVQKMFVAPENDMSAMKDKIQVHRNAWAKQEAIRIQKEKDDAKKIADKAKEVIAMNSFIELELNKMFINQLTAKKTKMLTAFNSITLAKYDDACKILKALPLTYDKQLLNEFNVRFGSRQYTTQEEFDIALIELKEKLFPEFQTKWAESVKVIKDDLVDRLPSKKTELEAIEKASDDAKQKLIDDAAERENLEKQNVVQEAETATNNVEQVIDSKAQEGNILADFQALASSSNTSAAELRSGYEIEIMNPSAWVQIFQLWFQNEGVKLSVAEIGTKKMDSMKTWCEKYAHKTGTKIESQFIVYVEKFSAKNKKTNE